MNSIQFELGKSFLFIKKLRLMGIAYPFSLLYSFLHCILMFEEVSVSVQEKINQEIKEAMKNKDKFRIGTLKYIKSLVQNNGLTKKPLPELDVIIGHHKKMSKMLEVYSGDALNNLEKEILIIEEFVPKPLSEEELSSLIDKHISLGNMGAIMKAVKSEITGFFDGSLVSSLIKSKLS